MRLLRRPSPAMVVALFALFVALGGTSYAAFRLPKNSVGTGQLKSGAVTRVKIAKKTIASLRGARGATGPQGPAGQTGAAGPAGPPAPTFNAQFTGDDTHPAIEGSASGSNALGAVVGLDPTGSTPGIFGQSNQGFSVWGDGGYAGVEGDGSPYGVEGSGHLAGLLSDTDLAVFDHIYVEHRNGVAGTCSVTAGMTSATCSFQPAFQPTTTPIVVVTPTANPGTFYYVTNTTTSGFTVNIGTSLGTDLEFNYLVIGIASCVFPGSGGVC